MLLTLGQITPYIFLPIKALELGYTPWQAAELLAITGASEMTGKFFFGAVGNLKQVNLQILFTFTTFTGGLSSILIAATSPYELLALFGATAGFFSGE